MAWSISCGCYDRPDTQAFPELYHWGRLILSQKVCLISHKKSRPLRVSPEVCNLGVVKALNIQTMHFTKVQISELMRKHAEKANGHHDLMEIMLESMMVAERSEFLREYPSNKGNGYRPGHAYGQGRKLEFRIPRDCHGNFHPRILAILRNQEEECDRLAGALYTKGLTQKQVGDVFDHLWPALFQVQYQQDGR